MPATLLSHQALVLPLKMRWPHRFSGLALCIGSMAPDFEFIARMSDDWIFSHTIAAQIWFTVPISMALIWLLTTLLIPTLLPYLGDLPSVRVQDLSALRPPSSVRGWFGVAISSWIGGMSHILLDGITHGNHSGWLVPAFPLLRMPIHVFGVEMPLHDSLQMTLTLLFGVATLLMWRVIARRRLLWHWQHPDAHRDIGLDVTAQSPGLHWPRERCAPRRSPRRLAFVCLLAALQGGVYGLHTRVHQSAPAGGDAVSAAKSLWAAVAFGAIDFLILALFMSAMVVRVTRMRSVVVHQIPPMPHMLSDPTHI